MKELKPDLFKASIVSANRISHNTIGITEFFIKFSDLIKSVEFDTITKKPVNVNIYHFHEVQAEIFKIDQIIDLLESVSELSDEICENAIDLCIAVNSLKKKIIALCNEEN
jgi:hypothetical protein